VKQRRGRAFRILGLLGWLLVLLASLTVVTWRQTEGVAREKALREVQTEHSLVAAERMELERRIQALSTRARVVRVARERLGMHLPSDGEIILLPLVADSVTSFASDGGPP
jgi:cell division protein FtsL